MSRIFITGIGIISPLGETVAANCQALRDGNCRLSPAERLESKYAGNLHFGEIKSDDEELRGRLKVREKRVNRTTLLAFHALKAAIADSQLTKKQLNSRQTALVCANTVGGMSFTDELYHDAHHATNGRPFNYDFDFGSVTLWLQQCLGIGGIVNTINTACSSSANAILYGARLIKNGRAERAIVGGADCLAKFTVNGFNALSILSPDKCRPFDSDRNGLNLGEGAAFLVLEKEDSLSGKNVYAEIKGYGNTNDAFHPSSLSDEGNGPVLAMQRALQTAGLLPSAISFINAHGTGTENNDRVESRALLRLFDAPPPFASTKSNIGHTLGAAGAIEAVFSILSVFHDEIYPGLNFSAPIPETGLAPVRQYRQLAVQHVLSNSFGFGGNCTALIFSKA